MIVAHPEFGPEIWIASSNWIQSNALKLLLGLEEVIQIDNRGGTQPLIAVFGMNRSKKRVHLVLVRFLLLEVEPMALRR